MFRKRRTNSADNIGETHNGLADAASVEYWNRHNITAHHKFVTTEESLAYLRWRNDQYFNYIDLMPVEGFSGKRVLDFGCGPGHDLVGFGTSSRPARLIGMDVSASSLQEAEERLSLHGIKAELKQIDGGTWRIPLETSSIEHVHCSGVLHHTPNPKAILGEFRRILTPGGTARVMVYNRESIWFHLYVAYQVMLVEGRYTDLNVDEAFGKLTDGEDCPISRSTRPDEWVALAEGAGFRTTYLGAAVSMHEAALLSQLRFQAIQDRRLPEESRRFLIDIHIDGRGLPRYRGTYAGVDACFHLEKAA